MHLVSWLLVALRRIPRCTVELMQQEQDLQAGPSINASTVDLSYHARSWLAALAVTPTKTCTDGRPGPPDAAESAATSWTPTDHYQRLSPTLSLIMTSSTIPSCPPSVLVLGAGELGIEIIKSLAQHPLRSSNAIDLAVLLRSSTITSDSAAKQAEIQAIKDLGFRVVAGDVVHDTREDLSRIFKDFHTVISCTGMTFPPGTQVKITKAVLEAGCARYFPWQFGVDYDVIGRESSQDLFTEQLNVRDLLRAQEATQWVIVSTGMFISFLFLPEFGIVNEAQTLVTAIGGWDNRLTVTSPADIGRITAALALQYTNEEGVVFLAGDTVSMGDLVEIIRSNSQGKEVMTELKTVEDLKAELVEDPENPMKKYRVVFGEGRGVSWEKEKTFNYRIGMEMETVKDWAAKSFK